MVNTMYCKVDLGVFEAEVSEAETPGQARQMAERETKNTM